MLAALCLLAVGGEPCAPASPAAPGNPAVHAIAFVNDWRSHGVVGDDFLSLNEVIQLHNRTLTFFQLSVNEQNQISGLGQDVAWADIDATATPTITVERDLDVILDMPHGLLISGSNGLPVIDFTASTVQNGFRAISNYCNWRYLILHGGPFGIDLQQTDAIYGTYLDSVVFELHTQFAFRCTGTQQNAGGRVLVNRCQFRSVPTCMQFDETAAGRSTFVFVGETRMANATTGLEVLLGNGGSGLCWLEKLEIAIPGTGIRIARPGGGSRALSIEATHLRVAAGSALEINGTPNADTSLTMRMLDLTATTVGGFALDVGPIGGRIRGVLEECRWQGNVDLHTGGAAGALAIGNVRAKLGNVSLGTNPSQQLTIRDSRFDSCSVATTGTGPIQIADSCLVGGTVTGSIVAPVQCTGSFLGTTVGTGVTVAGSLPAAQLGSMRVLPLDPTIGGSLTLQADLPAGLFAFLAMGATAATPFIQPPPMHVYLDLAGVYTFPGIYRLGQGITFPIPNNILLIGSDWVAQAAVFPDPGVQAPPLQLPPGSRFVIR